jgi:hypothetical protein
VSHKSTKIESAGGIAAGAFFHSDNPVNRAQMVIFLVRLLDCHNGVHARVL